MNVMVPASLFDSSIDVRYLVEGMVARDHRFTTRHTEESDPRQASFELYLATTIPFIGISVIIERDGDESFCVSLSSKCFIVFPEEDISETLNAQHKLRFHETEESIRSTMFSIEDLLEFAKTHPFLYAEYKENKKTFQVFFTNSMLKDFVEFVTNLLDSISTLNCPCHSLALYKTHAIAAT